MKKHVLTFTSLLLFAASTFAQFTAGEIWSLNLRVDPIVHNSINLAGIEMGVTYNSTGIPLTGNSSAPLGYPTFRITSTVTGNTIVCISSEKEGNDPWEDKERTTFTSDGTNDTSVVVERSNNGSPFTNDSKIIIERGSDPNQLTHYSYRWLSNTWQLSGKAIYYLTNNRIDSVVGFKATGSDYTRNSYVHFYYSTGLDSTLQTVLQASNNQFELANKTIVTKKENGKTKAFAIFARNGSGQPLQQTGVIVYSNGPASGLTKQTSEQNIALYPNPANHTIHLSLANNTSIQQVNILNMNGQEVLTFSAESHLDISNLTPGLYVIQVISHEGSSTHRFIKN